MYIGCHQYCESAKGQQLNDVWEFLDDNPVAFDLFNREGIDSSSVLPQQTPELCERCERLDFSAAGFVIEHALFDLKMRSQRCEFCSLLLETSERLNIGDPGIVKFHKVGSSLMINDRDAPVLSICRTPGMCAIM